MRLKESASIIMGMLLKRLELAGFKSFARPTTLEFRTPITAVVGPNGSGKSNIVEAMRFVLGEQSMKSLRGKRGEDLIFHGGKSLARQNRASVSVVFDNSREVFHLDYDEVEIKRVVYRDGANQYFINGSKTRLRDILELLAAVHIGASSHHIISQGETDRILNASAAERRGMIEDALGLKLYHYKLAESEKKLRKTEENIAQTETLRKEISSHLHFLEKQVEKIRAAETLRADAIELYKIYLKNEETLLAVEREALQKEKAVPEREGAEIEKKIKEKRALRPAAAGLHAAGERGIKDAARLDEIAEKLKEAQKEKDALTRSLGRLEGLLEGSAREKERYNESPRVSFPRAAVEEFRKNVHEAADEGERAHDIAGALAALRSIKEKISSFFEKYTGELKGGFDEEAFRKLASEKEKTAEALQMMLQKEKELSGAFEEARSEIEKERGAERLIEKELFALEMREGELRTQMKLFAFREERLREEEARFRAEMSEAGNFLGTQMLRPAAAGLRFGDKEMPSEKLPSREEQAKKKQKIERLKIKIEEIGGGGEEITKEYDEVRERDSFLAREISDLVNTAASLEKLIKELLVRIDTEFKDGVEKINKEFQDIFRGCFGGGNAELRVVTIPAKRQRSTDEIVAEEKTAQGEFDEVEDEEGIDIAVTLPTKKVKGLAVLSGGERSLTSIALVFAITLVNPPPFLILDETDAALDESNSQKYGALLAKLKGRTQFIVITHNRETMTRAGVLYGVTSGADGASRVLSVKMDEAEELSE